MNKPGKFVMMVLVIMSCLLFSCGRTEQRKWPDIFVISSLAKTENEHFNLPLQVFGEKQFYHHYNFIIDSAGDLFYYSIPHHFEGRIAPGPVFVNLYPDQIIQIPGQSAIDFLKINILNKKNFTVGISIASQKDTINSWMFSEMNRFLSDSTEGVKYYVRMTTNEENVVLSYKKRMKIYDPTMINWDSTTTIFMKPPIVTID